MPSGPQPVLEEDLRVEIDEWSPRKQFMVRQDDGGGVLFRISEKTPIALEDALAAYNAGLRHGHAMGRSEMQRDLRDLLGIPHSFPQER